MSRGLMLCSPYLETYKTRALAMVDYLGKYCPEGTLDIPSPAGGMFLWIKLRIDSHPQYGVLTPDEISRQVFDSFIKEKVLVAPGHFFKSPRFEPMTREEEATKTFIRLSYALPPLDEMEEGVKRMGRALRNEWHLA